MPSDIRKYLAYIAELKREYGSVVNFIVEKRLQWTDRRPQDSNPFDNPKTGNVNMETCTNFSFAKSYHQDDIKVLYNDWPYGIDEKIVHLVVWTKFDLDDDPTADDLTPLAREKIENYVYRTFRTRVPTKDVGKSHTLSILQFKEVINSPIGNLVQELEIIEVCARSRAFPCDAVQP